MGFCQFFLNLRRAELLEAETDALDKECHVQTQLAHGLHALLVAYNLTWGCAVGDAPVLRIDQIIDFNKSFVAQKVTRCI